MVHVEALLVVSGGRSSINGVSIGVSGVEEL